jgi:hypothetical protein
MLGYNQQMQFVSSMTKAFADSATDMMRTSASLWSPEEKAPEPGRSWYRAPKPDLFDWSSWLSPAMPMTMPWNMWSTPFGPSMMSMSMPMMAGSGFQPWSTLAMFANAMAVFEPAQNYWSALTPPSKQPAAQAQALALQVMMWPVNQLEAATAKAQPPKDFASHRSSSGHASVPIVVLPEPVPRADNDKLH